MKKLLLSTIVLLAFSISIIVFQLSCKKSADAQTSTYTLLPATISRLGGVIPDGTTISVDASGKISTISNGSVTQQNKILFQKDLYSGAGNTNKFDSGEIWSANYDGTNQQKVNVALPTGFVITLGSNIKLSPDGKTIFFDAFFPGTNYPTTSTPWSIYACNIDGSNVRLIIQGTSTASVETSVAY
jgi:hypothetical protein